MNKGKMLHYYRIKKTQVTIKSGAPTAECCRCAGYPRRHMLSATVPFPTISLLSCRLLSWPDCSVVAWSVDPLSSCHLLSWRDCWVVVCWVVAIAELSLLSWRSVLLSWQCRVVVVQLTFAHMSYNPFGPSLWSPYKRWSSWFALFFCKVPE